MNPTPPERRLGLVEAIGQPAVGPCVGARIVILETAVETVCG
jgi:hypothetical protein